MVVDASVRPAVFTAKVEMSNQVPLVECSGKQGVLCGRILLRTVCRVIQLLFLYTGKKGIPAELKYGNAHSMVDVIFLYTDFKLEREQTIFTSKSMCFKMPVLGCHLLILLFLLCHESN